MVAQLGLYFEVLSDTLYSGFLLIWVRCLTVVAGLNLPTLFSSVQFSRSVVSESL